MIQGGGGGGGGIIYRLLLVGFGHHPLKLSEGA